MAERMLLMREQELIAAVWVLVDSESSVGGWFLLSAVEQPPNFIGNPARVHSSTFRAVAPEEK